MAPKKLVPPIDVPGASAMQVLKFGPGIIARTSPIMVALCIVVLAAVGAVRDNPWMVLSLVIILIVALALYIVAMLRHVDNHPEHMYEGSTAVAIKRLEAEQGAGLRDVLDISPGQIPGPNSASPPSLPGAE